MNDNYRLQGGVNIITHTQADAWRVSSGSVLIYIAPWINNALSRRVFLYEAQAGEVIPSLCYKDYSHTQWRFCFVAVDTAELELIKNGNTSILRTRFAQKVKLPDRPREGFESSVVNFYKLAVVAEDGLIYKTILEHKATSENIYKLIYNIFNKGQLKIKTKREGNPLYDAVSIICNRSGIPIAPLEKILEVCPNGLTVSDIARVSHFSCREIILDENWPKSDSGALLAFEDSGRPVACIPRGQRGYTAHYAETGEVKPMTPSRAKSIIPKAFALYRPLPNKPLSPKDLFSYCLKSVNITDVAQIFVFTLICSVIGLLLPTLNQLLFDVFIPLGASSSVIQIGFVIGAAMVGSVFFTVAQNLANFRVSSRIGIDFQNAMQDRLFNLPMKFFRQYESAELAQRMSGATVVIGAVVNAILVSGLTAVLSVLYLARMMGYSAELSWAGVLMLTVYAVIILLLSHRVTKFQQQIQEISGKANSALYQYISGIAKIRMSGAEDRALYEYLKLYVYSRELQGKQHVAASVSAVIAAASSGLFSIVLYWLMIRGSGNISLGEFIAFVSAFGVFSGAFMQVIAEISQLRVMKSTYERCKPILTETPEFDEGKELPGNLNGEIEINSITFAYAKDAPNVLENLSLNIKAGEYIGIVGPSGCGKSTLLKLLLGFETPSSGKIYYNGKDLESLDKRELRKKMGVVLQDGKLIAGSIFENITITSPQSTLADAEQVIRAVGLETDVGDMPMGLHTILSEDSGAISGGQQQRILIARAIIGKPAILFFDEATSALDNITQAMVCASLDAMKTTRLVIAHRLSTVINCDRIIVMDAGKIVEQGNYQELMDARGLFFDLASRQIT